MSCTFIFLKKGKCEKHLWKACFLLRESPELPKKSQFTEMTLQTSTLEFQIPAHAEIKVIRPKMQLSGGLTPVSLKRKRKRVKTRADFQFGLNVQYVGCVTVFCTILNI